MVFVLYETSDNRLHRLAGARRGTERSTPGAAMGDLRGTETVRWVGPYMSSDRERTWIGRVESPAWRTGWAVVAQVRQEVASDATAG